MLNISVQAIRAEIFSNLLHFAETITASIRKPSRCIVKSDGGETEYSYRHEGKLATMPTTEVIDKYSNKCHGKLVQD
jgi:hypothetical protein